jgi:hypothetical protein
VERSESGGAPEAGRALVTHRERSDPAPPRGCPTPVPGLRMVAPGKRWLPVRCGRRSCPHCDKLAALELARVLWLDSIEDPPAGVLVLTTVDPAHSTNESDAFTRSMEQVVKALRRRWPTLEYLAWIEFTTGRGPRSGGARRIHAHVLLKGISPDVLPLAEDVARRVWLDRMGAHRVTCEPIRTARALAHYLAHHHRKPEQAPPAWWSGKRTRPSRGYFAAAGGIAALRAEARRQLGEERRLWSALNRLGEDAPAALVELELQAMRQAEDGHRWEVVRVREGALGIVTPLGPPVGAYRQPKEHGCPVEPATKLSAPAAMSPGPLSMPKRPPGRSSTTSTASVTPRAPAPSSSTPTASSAARPPAAAGPGTPTTARSTPAAPAWPARTRTSATAALMPPR